MLIGRSGEIKIMDEMLHSNSSELIAIYGRRRVGKTFLIREIYQKHIVFELIGLYKGSKKDQLKNFNAQLKLSSKRFENSDTPNDWFKAFELLKDYLNGLKSQKKKVIFIDEFPWIATSRSKFLMVFEHFWNSYCTKRNDLVVMVCGSAASFMVNKIIKNKGGLHNRLSHKIRLMPFTLHETEVFLKSKNILLSHFDILQLYMIIGGVPHYLNNIKKGESVAQNIDRLCFEGNGALVDEFTEVFKSLFENSEVHEQIVRELSKIKKGVTRKELLDLCKMGSGGVFTKTLDELTESGFVTQYQPFGKRKKDSLFRLSDEYSLFFLKFMEPNLGQGAGTWAKMFPKQSYKTWCGLMFETVCLKHIEQIKKELGVAKIYSINSSWRNENAQVDLIIDRDDGIINLCEMKFYNGLFTINKPEYEIIRNKLLQFRQGTSTRKNVFVTMITTYGVAENANSLELVTNYFTMDCLFEP
ncbi:MAG: ATP-binding protein [Bacteroidales bacterium]|nr:ATP-binding protein [Bacteroidales bacterium]MCF8458587.1 ATP-binding protein [Bacteroidales bacterium]